MATVFVHIGLPKTATTSLQIDLFPRLAGANILHIGVYQPRYVPQHDLYKALYRSVTTGDGIANLRSQIEQTLNKGVSILVSEEMFTVSETRATWRIKLRRLSEILEGFDYRVIVTVRRPVDAMFSYYVELFPQFSKTGKTFAVLALEDETMEIFHYKKFFAEIAECFALERVFVKAFETLVAGDNQDLVHLIAGDGFLATDVQIGKRNERRNVGSAIVSQHGITAAELMRYWIKKYNVSNVQSLLIAKRFLRPVTKVLEQCVLKTLRVKKPSEEQLKHIHEYLEDDIHALNKLFHINYSS